MANDFLKIFSEGWEKFKSAVPSYDKPHYNKQVEAVLRCGDPVFGFSQYLCLKADNTVYGWGLNSTANVLLNGVYADTGTPVALDTALKFTTIDSAGGTTCGIQLDGKVYCWGLNQYGQLGDDTYDDQNVAPAPIASLVPDKVEVYGQPKPYSKVTDLDIIIYGYDVTDYQYKVGESSTTDCSLAAGYSTDISIDFKIDDDISALADVPIKLCVIGKNSVGYQSLASATEVNWTKITDYTGDYVILAGTNNSTLAIRTDNGHTYGWGSNYYGEVKSGLANKIHVPTLITDSLAFAQIASGADGSCGLLADGKAYCWGWNFYGHVGDGTNNPASEPTAVAGGHRFSKIAYMNAVCALEASDGTAYCWGKGWQGILGNGNNQSPR